MPKTTNFRQYAAVRRAAAAKEQVEVLSPRESEVLALVRSGG
jgi:DNA-binding CsgD family transcriptional regulator